MAIRRPPGAAGNPAWRKSPRARPPGTVVTRARPAAARKPCPSGRAAAPAPALSLEVTRGWAGSVAAAGIEVRQRHVRGVGSRAVALSPEAAEAPCAERPCRLLSGHCLWSFGSRRWPADGGPLPHTLSTWPRSHTAKEGSLAPGAVHWNRTSGLVHGDSLRGARAGGLGSDAFRRLQAPGGGPRVPRVTWGPPSASCPHQPCIFPASLP